MILILRWSGGPAGPWPLPEHLPGDHELLDLAGAFVDPEQPYVAVQPLDRDAADIPRAAVDLDRAVGDTADGFAGEVFRGRRNEPPVRAPLLLTSALQPPRPARTAPRLP